MGAWLVTSLFKILALTIFLISSTNLAYSEDGLEIAGHLKLKSAFNNFESGSLQDQVGSRSGGLYDYNFRPRFNVSRSDFRINIEGELNGVSGSSKSAIESFLPGRPLLENDRYRLFDLSTEEGGENFSRTSRLDRLSLSYATENANFRIGRQAFSYGKGIVFSVLDIFNPFSPVAYDREFKVGEDMATFKGNIIEKWNVQLVAVGRRDSSGSISSDASSFGSILNYEGEGYDVGFLFGANRGNAIGGLSFSKILSEYVLRVDASFYETENSSLKNDILVNIDRGIQVLGYETYLFIEYFYSGLGVSRDSYSDANLDLNARIRDGEIFTLSKHYLSGGARIELSDLVQLNLLSVVNILDGSSVHRPFLAIEPTDNTRIRIGVALSQGSRGEEFRGFDIDSLNSYISSSQQAFVQLAYYF